MTREAYVVISLDSCSSCDSVNEWTNAFARWLQKTRRNDDWCRPDFDCVRHCRRDALTGVQDTTNSWFPASRNVGNVRDVGLRNLVNCVGRWRNGHTLRRPTLRENMETKLHKWFLLVNSYGFYVKNRNRFYSYRFHVYVTCCRVRENVFHVYVIFYVTYVNYLSYVKLEITSNANYTVLTRRNNAEYAISERKLGYVQTSKQNVSL